MNFHNKVIIVTGASSGIGEATAIYLSEFGAQLVLVARNADKLHRVATECHRPCGLVPLIVPADITNEENVHNIEREVMNHYGKVDVLLNIAGGIFPETILHPNVEQFDKNINLNLRSVYLLMAKFAPHLQMTRGNIVNVTSIVTDLMIQGHCSYNVSKAGLGYLTKVAASELASKGVRVNSIQPGTTRTGIIESLGFSKAETEKTFNDIEKHVPLGKIMEPKEMAHAIAFLASDLAKNITGSCLCIDGGQVLHGPVARH